jgi:D-alanyl-D-alanine carboxypeptidase
MKYTTARLSILVCIVCMFATMVHAEIIKSLNLPKDTILMQGDTNLLGAQNGDWIQFLESRCGGRSCGRMRQLNPQFGQRVMQAIQAAEQQTGARARINDSFRSVQEQAAAYARYQNGGGLAAPPGRSYHGRGLAVDVGPAVIYTKLHQISSQYGIFNPPTIRGKDPVHFQMGSCDASCQAQTPPSGSQDTASFGQAQDATSQPGGQPSSSGQTPQQQASGQQGQGTSFGQNPNSFLAAQNGKAQDIPESKALVEENGDIEIECAPAALTIGSSASISWKCPTASQSRSHAQPNLASFNTKNKVQGVLRVAPKSKTTFTISCVKANKVVATGSCTIPITTRKQALSVRLVARPSEVRPGERVELSWSSTHAKSCTLSGPDVSSNDMSGRVTTEEITRDVTYSLTCVGLQKEQKITRTATVRFYADTQDGEYPADAL